MDAITPEAVPGTGVIVYNGLTPREAFLAAEAIAESRKLISMDMVEVNPFLDVSLQHWAYTSILEAANSHDYTRQSGVERWSRLF